MRHLSDLLQEITITALGNTSQKDTPERKQELIYLVNQGLLDLYSQFVVKERMLMVELRESRTQYPLTRSHYIHGEEDKHDYNHYIWDEDYIHKHDEAFAEYLDPIPDPEHSTDIIKILNVTTQDGEDLPLNNGSNPLSVFTPSPYVLQVPTGFISPALYVYYQAKHPEVKEDTDIIECPDVLIHPLIVSVAIKVLMRIGSQEALIQANTLTQRYQSLINNIISADTLSQSYAQDSVKFRSNGWI